jgi:hypothetical protein
MCDTRVNMHAALVRRRLEKMLHEHVHVARGVLRSDMNFLYCSTPVA